MGAQDRPANASERRSIEAQVESEARFVAQLAAMMAAAEVACSGPEMFFETSDHARLVKVARFLLKEARRQVRAAHDSVPVYDLDRMPSSA